MIVDNCEQHYLVSTDDPDRLIAAIEQARANALEALRVAEQEGAE